MGVLTTCDFALSPEQQQSYLQLQYSADSASFLTEALSLPDYRHDAHSAIVLDFVTSVLLACRKLQLGPHQTSAVLAIAQQLLQGCASGASRDEAQLLLRDSLLKLCSPAAAANPAAAATAEEEKPPTGNTAAAASGLTPDAISSLAALFTRGLLQHYSLYLLVFSQEQHHVQHQYHLMVESAVPPPPLELSLSEADWHAHLAAEQAQQEAEQAAAEAAEKARLEAEEAARIAQQQAEEAAARQEQLQRKPQTLGEAVDKLVALRLEEVRQTMAAEYAAKAASLAARVGQLEQQQLQQQQAGLAAAGGKGSRAGSAARSAV